MICEVTFTNASGGVSSKVNSTDIDEVTKVIGGFFRELRLSGGVVVDGRKTLCSGGCVDRKVFEELQSVGNGSESVVGVNVGKGHGQDVTKWHGVRERCGEEVFEGREAVRKSGSGVNREVKSCSGQLKRGPNYERNQAKREAKKLRDKARFGEARRTLEETWVLRNKLEAVKLAEKLRLAELSAVSRSPVTKVKTAERLRLESCESDERLKKVIEKHKADQLYWKKRQESGAVEKAIAVENEILDGQLSGKYDPFASRRVVGWAKTVKTVSSGSKSGSGSSGSANKTVWSGSGATTKTDLSVLEQKVAVYEEKLKKSEKDVVELGKKADKLNKQLITVTVESERKDKELFEVKKFKEYLEKAKKEKKRRADNEFEAFRTQADCSY